MPVKPEEFDTSKLIVGNVENRQGGAGNYEIIPVKYDGGGGKQFNLKVALTKGRNKVKTGGPRDLKNKLSLIFVSKDYETDDIDVASMILLYCATARNTLRASTIKQSKRVSKLVYPKFKIMGAEDIARLNQSEAKLDSVLDDDVEDTYENVKAVVEELDQMTKKQYERAAQEWLMDKMIKHVQDNGLTIDSAREAIQKWAPDGHTVIVDCNPFSFTDQKSGNKVTVNIKFHMGKNLVLDESQYSGKRLEGYPIVKITDLVHDQGSNRYRPRIGCHSFFVVDMHEMDDDGTDEYVDEVNPELYDKILESKTGVSAGNAESSQDSPPKEEGDEPIGEEGAGNEDFEVPNV